MAKRPPRPPKKSNVIETVGKTTITFRGDLSGVLGDKSRYCMADALVLFDSDGAMAVATDGQMMVVCPVETNGPPSDCFIHRDACIPHAPVGVENGVWSQTILGREVTDDCLPIDSFTPPCADVLPQDYSLGDVRWITLDAERLLRIAKAMGDSSNLSIGIRNWNQSIIVLSDDCDSIGLLMPVDLKRKPSCEFFAKMRERFASAFQAFEARRKG